MGECFISRRGGGGGGSGLNVVTGLSEPYNAKENTVWVKSDTAGKKYVFAEAEPEAAEEGLLWLSVTGKGIITAARVYSGGKWVLVDAYMFIGGKWVQIASAWDGTMYKDGAFVIGHTNRVYNGEIVLADTYYTAKTVGGTVSEAYIAFGPVDLTNYSVLSMQAKRSGEMNNAIAALFVTKVANGRRNDAVSKNETTVTGSNVYNLTIDINELSGDGWYVYAGINTQGGRNSNSRSVDVMGVSVA